jgi:hypothetical protein
VVRLLPDEKKWVDFFYGVYELYRRAGAEPALDQFRAETFAVTDRIAMTRAMDLNRDDQILANATYWFEHELRQYPATMLDLESLASRTDRVVPTVGMESRGYPAREATVELGKRLGRPMIEFPGGYVGCMTQPAGFTAALMRALMDRLT